MRCWIANGLPPQFLNRYYYLTDPCYEWHYLMCGFFTKCQCYLFSTFFSSSGIRQQLQQSLSKNNQMQMHFSIFLFLANRFQANWVWTDGKKIVYKYTRTTTYSTKLTHNCNSMSVYRCVLWTINMLFVVHSHLFTSCFSKVFH